MLRDKLRNNKKLVYWYRCFRNRNTKAYKEFVFDDTQKLTFKAKDNNFGDFNNVYYDIFMRDSVSGFFAIYRWILSSLYVADRFNMIPHISIIHTLYSNEDEDFFKLYFSLRNGVESIENKANVLEYNSGHLMWLDDKYGLPKGLPCGYDIGEDYINELASIKNKYLDFNNELENKIIIQIDNLLNKEKTIGVHYRGTDYKAGFKGHPIALSPSDYFEYIDELLNLDYKKIFVATDDKTALDEFIDRYGDKIVYYKDTERSSDGKSVHEFSKSDVHQKGYDVLRDMLTLSNCDSLICGKSQVSIAARVEKSSKGKKYDYFKLIDKGNYTVDNRKEYYKK